MFLEPGTGFMEDNFFHGPGRVGWFRDDSITLFILHFISIIIIL